MGGTGRCGIYFMPGAQQQAAVGCTGTTIFTSQDLFMYKRKRKSTYFSSMKNFVLFAVQGEARLLRPGNLEREKKKGEVVRSEKRHREVRLSLSRF
jgi:hypothetical protein